MGSSTTTIRVEKAVHERLVEISHDSGRQLVDTIRDATEALERARFAEKVRIQLDVLRGDSAAWAEYIAEFDVAVSDGLT